MIRVAAATWAGKRTVNEDRCDISEQTIVLADGAGGLVTGALAARLATLGILAGLDAGHADPPGLVDAFRAVHQLIAATAAAEALPSGTLANRVEADLDDQLRSLIAGAAARRLTLSGMFASTLACVIRGTTLQLAHLGNVRAYHLRGGELRLLTSDHALPPPHAHLVTHALGANFEDPQLVTQELLPGDLVFLCTDGIHRCLDEPSLSALLASPATPSAMLSAVRDAARESDDNLGAVVIHAGHPFASTLHNDPPW